MKRASYSVDSFLLRCFGGSSVSNACSTGLSVVSAVRRGSVSDLCRARQLVCLEAYSIFSPRQSQLTVNLFFLAGLLQPSAVH